MPSVSPTPKREWQRRRRGAKIKLSWAAEAVLNSTSSLLSPSPIAGVPAQFAPGCGAGAPLFKRAGKLPRSYSLPRVALAAQWSRRLGPVSAARGASFVCSASSGARGPRPASWVDKARAAASRTYWSRARTTLLPPWHRPLPSTSSDWPERLQRGWRANGSRGEARLLIGQERLPIGEGGLSAPGQVVPSVLGPARGAGRLSEGGGDGAPGGGGGDGCGGFPGPSAGRRR